MNKYKKIWIIVTTFILLLIISMFFMIDKEKLEHFEYKEFYEYLEEGKIKEAKIENDKVEFFKLEGESSGEWYYTENPHYDGFEEKLLLNGVKVQTISTSEDIAFIIDLMFYLFFFGIIIFTIVKVVKSTGENFKVIKHTNIKFDDIAGMDELKNEMSKTVEILKNPKKYKEKGIRPTKGIILEGPPGNGKTLFAKALAGETDVKFIATRGADF